MSDNTDELFQTLITCCANPYMVISVFEDPSQGLDGIILDAKERLNKVSVVYCYGTSQDRPLFPSSDYHRQTSRNRIDGSNLKEVGKQHANTYGDIRSCKA